MECIYITRATVPQRKCSISYWNRVIIRDVLCVARVIHYQGLSLHFYGCCTRFETLLGDAHYIIFFCTRYCLVLLQDIDHATRGRHVSLGHHARWLLISKLVSKQHSLHHSELPA